MSKDHRFSRSNPHNKRKPPYDVVCEDCGHLWTLKKENEKCPNCLTPQPNKDETRDKAGITHWWNK